MSVLCQSCSHGGIYCGECDEEKYLELHPSNDLPQGKTCKDCAYWKRCSVLIDELTGDEDYCDWTPSGFKENSGYPQVEAVDPITLDVFLELKRGMKNE